MTVEPAFDERGMLPAVVQDSVRGTVLMIAWMNAEALRKTRDTGFVHFWSRSRQALWQKGETSGNTLAVKEIRIDCDADAILVRATPAGPTCHTGKTACFYRVVDGTIIIEDDGVPDPTFNGTVLDRLAAVIEQRKTSTSDVSYTRSLLDGGMPKILDKIAEEYGELAAELPSGTEAEVVHETADLLFHLLVALGARGVPVERVWQELERRQGKTGHQEKAER